MVGKWHSRRASGLFLVAACAVWQAALGAPPKNDATGDDAANNAANVLSLDNGTVKVGIDRSKGAAITWLSWTGYSKNAVNHADPGRLVQQSYYAGKVKLAPKSTYRYRYWLAVGTESELAKAFDSLSEKHGDERAELSDP